MASRAEVIINTPADRERVARWARETGYGTVVLFKKKSRSTEQNAKMWAMLSEVSEQVEWYGNKLSPEDWKIMFTASLRKANVLPGIDAGTVVPLGLSTSAMTIEEMKDLIELIYAFGAERGVIFTDPQEQSNSNTDDNPAPSSVDADAQSSASEAVDETPTPSTASIDHHAWLLNIARLLWAATSPNGDVDVFNVQRKVANDTYPMAPDCPEQIQSKAKAVSRYCLQVINNEMEKSDGLAMVAGVVGVDQDDILKQAEAL